MKTRILAVSAVLMLALGSLTACNGGDDDSKKCKSNAATVQTFAKPGGGGGGGGGKGGGSKGGSRGGSKSKTGQDHQEAW